MKRGMFFSLDAFIALAIIFVLLLTVSPLVQYSQPATQVPYDLMTSLSALSVGEINNAYVQSLIASGEINNTNNTVLEQIGEFYATNTTKAKLLADSVLSTLPIKQNVGIWYESKLISSVNTTPYESASNVETARQVITGIQEGSSVTGFSARASLASSMQARYFYFGGYVGDGNITTRIDYDGNITSAEIEVAINNDFNISVNGNFVGQYNKSSSPYAPQKYAIPTTYFSQGQNLVKFSGKDLYISGGYIKILYEREDIDKKEVRKYLPGIEGIVNIYDSFSTAGQLSNMTLHLRYNTNHSLFVTIGNVTVFTSNTTGETNYSLPNANLSALLDYNSLSNTNIPLRIGVQEVALNGTDGNADVILITDVSGSMDWRLDTDNVAGTARSCSDASLSAGSTKRISLARCLDSDFIDTVLSAPGNRIGLVSFSTSANSYVNLTTNKTLLNNTVMAYTVGGSTCVSCAINRAYMLLQANSNSSRKQFIVTMTDGVTNVRSTNTCVDFLAGGGTSTSSLFAAGASGYINTRNSSAFWNVVNSPTSNQINDIDFHNSTLAFGVGSSGTIMQFNGNTWDTVTSPTSTTLNGVDIRNDTFAIAVGSSGRVISWNGATWSNLSVVASSPTLYAVSILNHTAIFIAAVNGTRGNIYKSVNGASSWTRDFDAGTNSDVFGVKMLNNTRGYAVGENGDIHQWSGSSWSTITSPTTHNLYSIESLNHTHIFAGGGDNGNTRIIESSGGTWTAVYSTASADTVQDIAVLNTSAYAFGEGATLIEYNASTDAWTRTFNIFPAYAGNLTNGLVCSADEDTCSEVNSFPALNANYSACRAHADLNSTIYSIGFGPVSSCAFASQLLQGIATCGNGTYFASTDAAALEEFYESIAADILKVSYTEQTAQVTGNLSMILYPESYIEFTDNRSKNPFGMLITLEQPFTNTTLGNFSVPANTQIVEAQICSYSGPRWTALVRVNNQQIYNLSRYGSKYAVLGDPFQITIPTSSIQASNNVTLITGLGPQNLSEGSTSNKIVYTVVRNISSYSSISGMAQGCIWTVDFEDNTNITVRVPSSYAGIDTCSYQESQQVYNSQDAFQSAAYQLLQLIDFDSDYKIDVKFSEQNLQIAETAVTGIPFTWSTEVQIRTWS